MKKKRKKRTSDANASPTSRSMPCLSLSIGYFGRTAHPVFTAKHVITWHGVSIWSVWVLAVSPPRLLRTPGLVPGDTEWGTERALALCKHSSAIAKTLLCYQCCFGHIADYSTIQAAGKNCNTMPARASTNIPLAPCGIFRLSCITLLLWCNLLDSFNIFTA